MDLVIRHAAQTDTDGGQLRRELERTREARCPYCGTVYRLVDEADVVQDVAVEPAAPGLDLICRGLRRTSPDDLTALARGGLVYDALYAELAAGEAV